MAVAYGGDTRPYVIDVVRVEPQGYASFRWASAFGGAEPAPGNATLVEFYLRTVGDEMGVTVVESGFTSLDLPEELRADEWKGNRGGWQFELSGLRTRAESDYEAPPDPDRVFAALADARRRELLELLARGPGASAGGLAALLPVSRQAVAQHLAVLEEARLVTRRRAGRQVLFAVRPEALTATAGWLAARAVAWERQAAVPGGPDSPRLLNFPADQGKDTLL